jgi:hypothetical protein
VLGALVLASPAQASHDNFRVGVHAIPVTGPDIDAMERANVQSLRMNLLWRNVETVPPANGSTPCSQVAYDWTQYDSLFGRALSQGVPVLPILLGSPRYAARGVTVSPDMDDGRAKRGFQCFVRAAVRRYGRGGTIPGQLGVNPITDWQVWNEPNLRQYAANEDPNHREYARLLDVADDEIKDGDDRANTVLAGMPEASSGLSLVPYVKRLYRDTGAERDFDVLAAHIYGEDERGVRGGIIRVREMLDDLNDESRWTWITETGYASDGPQDHFLVSSERGQANRLRDTLDMIRDNRRRYRIGTVNVFRWRDNQDQANQEFAFEYAGIYRQNGTPKPACGSFVGFTGGTCPHIEGLPGVASAESLVQRLDAPAAQQVQSSDPE